MEAVILFSFVLQLPHAVFSRWKLLETTQSPSLPDKALQWCKLSVVLCGLTTGHSRRPFVSSCGSQTTKHLTAIESAQDLGASVNWWAVEREAHKCSPAFHWVLWFEENICYISTFSWVLCFNWQRGLGVQVKILPRFSDGSRPASAQ